MKRRSNWNYLVCHLSPERVGSMITHRSTLYRAKVAAHAQVIVLKVPVGVWDNANSAYVYKVNPQSE